MDLKEELSGCGQYHLLRFWNELTSAEKTDLVSDLQQLDVPQATADFQQAVEGLTQECGGDEVVVEPLPDTMRGVERALTTEERRRFETEALRRVAQGHVGVVLLAGGQGTRLGHPGPKGTLDVGLPSRKSLFQLQAERLRRVQEMAKRRCTGTGRITWYVMTSDATHTATKRFVARLNYFGLQKDDVVFFRQASRPCFSTEGEVLLEKKHRISRAPCGNGGVFRALLERGVLDHMDEHGVSLLHVHGVDNVLVRTADPVFIGFCLSRDADAALKVVQRRDAREELGIVCNCEGRLRVLEFCELPRRVQERPDEFHDGSVCELFLTTEFVRKVAQELEPRLTYHVAKKKVTHLDSRGLRRVPDRPNALKMEKFIGDALAFAERPCVLEVRRREHFSPIKNDDSHDKDTPATARNDFLR